MTQGIVNGRLLLPETATPTAIADHGQVYAKTDNQLYFQDGAGNEHLVHPIKEWKSYTFVSRASVTGISYLGGFYTAPSGDANLTDAGPTVTHGGANAPYGAHAFIVSGGNGTTDGSTLVLTVSGTSITDGGTRTGSDTEVIEATALDSALDTYFETTKKWIGQITYTLTSDGGTFTYDFNYGFAKYDDFGNVNFTLTNFECVGIPDADDASFELEILHHKTTGWTYSAAAFAAGAAPLYQLTTIYSTESDIDAGEPFAFKRTGLSDAIAGDSGEGLLVRVTTGAAKAIAFMDVHFGVQRDV